MKAVTSPALKSQSTEARHFSRQGRGKTECHIVGAERSFPKSGQGLVSTRDPRLCVVLAGRGGHEATVLCGAAYRLDQLAARSGASGDRGRAAHNEVNLRRGFLRLGIGLVLLWLVFWNCAYVISPYNTSLKPEPAFVILVTEWRVLAPCLVAAVLLGGWIAVGFRSN
jgi:hypothetical protein